MSLSLGLGLRLSRRAALLGGTTPSGPTIIAFMGQSNLEYILNNGSTYTNVSVLATTPITTVNARFIGPGGINVVINQAAVDARQINPAMAELSQFLAFIAPGRQFIFVDLSQSGTSRGQLADDSEPERTWTTFMDAVTAAEAYGQITAVIEYWYANDASANDNFTNNYSPFYLGQYADGVTTFPLNTTFGSYRWDHILWDVTAPSLSSKGTRGAAFARTTFWTYVGTHHKDSSLVRANSIETFRNDPRVAPFALPRGVWAGHYANDSSHALVNDPDGQIYFMWPFAVSCARLAGVTIHEPEYQLEPEVASDGSYADILVSLPNGGTLTTIRALEGRAGPPGPRIPSYRQAAIDARVPVTGMEWERAGFSRSPIHRTDAAVFDRDSNYDGGVEDDKLRGTVVIQDSGSGVAPNRFGRIRVIPMPGHPFVNGEKIIPMHPRNANTYPQTFDPTGAIDGSNGLPATSKIWLDFPVESVSSLRHPTRTHKFPGVPVRPFGPEQLIAGVGPPFVFAPRSVVTSATQYLIRSPLAAPFFAGDEGLVSVWFRCTEATWPTGAKLLLQLRDSGGSPSGGLTSASSGRISHNFSGSGLPQVAAGAFTLGVWQHLLLSWKTGAGGWAHTCVNGQAPGVGASPAPGTPQDGTALLVKTAGVGRIGVGTQTGAAGFWLGEIAHFYINLSQGLDLTDPANRAKFIVGNNPVSLGERGELPTGGFPQFYFDGTAPAWNNASGVQQSLVITGAPLIAGSTPLLGAP